MDIREYASGGKSHRFGITRQGNAYLGTAFIEANQRGYRSAPLRRCSNRPIDYRGFEPMVDYPYKKGHKALFVWLAERESATPGSKTI